MNKPSLLEKRKLGLKGLYPLETQSSIMQQTTNAGNSENFETLKINVAKSQNTNSNGNSPLSGGLTPTTRRKLL